MNIQPNIRRGKMDIWTISFNGCYIKIGSKKNAIKLFTIFLKAKQIKEDTGNKHFEEFDLKDRKIKILWSRTCRLFYCEIYIGDEQIASFQMPMNNTKMIRQCEYFMKYNPEKKEMFEKIIEIYGK